MDPIVSLPEPFAGMDGATVKFRLIGHRGDPPVEVAADGNGIFHVEEAGEAGKYFVSISVSIWPESVGTLQVHDFRLNQASVDRLRLTAPGAEFQLECVDPSLPEA